MTTMRLTMATQVVVSSPISSLNRKAKLFHIPVSYSKKKFRILPILVEMLLLYLSITNYPLLDQHLLATAASNLSHRLCFSNLLFFTSTGAVHTASLVRYLGFNFLITLISVHQWRLLLYRFEYGHMTFSLASDGKTLEPIL
ncbi:hypothetical protein L6452_08372 [Arctium lappa]|uniref:Uncharacterized protein n=1 Tax=Arctium lappa TaxID=4217 RepID=A0ACB9DH25_ARCLA|nr:hypothetical protein L6452_08372 [Arctium lappa]